LIHFDWDGLISKRTASVAECFNDPQWIVGTYEFITRIARELARPSRRPSGLTAFLIDLEFCVPMCGATKYFPLA
jgi:hypothetical protein